MINETCRADRILLRNGEWGAWGHSYVKTYYEWIGAPLDPSIQFEGGIATTYYVLESLQSSPYKLTSLEIKEVASFLLRRADSEGIGILTVDPRTKETKVAAHLRHTCYGYLSLRCLDAPKATSGLETVEKAIRRNRQVSDLMRDWGDWPIGGIASYIVARDKALDHGATKLSDLQMWNGVRANLLHLLVNINSRAIHRFYDREMDGVEHYPYFEPINNLSVLRLHSTLGCLHLVGKEIAQTDAGKQRIRAIVEDVKRVSLTGEEPRFSPDRRCSLAAACAMLCLVLGPWIEPNHGDLEFILNLLKFVESNWNSELSEVDAWTEFLAPLLALPELWTGVNTST